MTTTTTTTAPVYVKPDGSAYDEADTARIEKYRDDLLDGTVFHRHARGHRSRYGYQPPIGHRDWAHCMERLGQMAAESSMHAHIARHIIGRVNLYGDAGQAAAAVYQAAAEAIAEEYDDIIGRTGPEAGRWSSYHQAYPVEVILSVAAWLAEACAPFTHDSHAYGWTAAAIARAENVRVYGAHKFTRVKV